MCSVKWNAIEFDYGGNSASSSTLGTDCLRANNNNDADFLTIPFGTDLYKRQYVDRYCGQRFSSSYQQVSTTNDDVYCE